MPSPPSLETIVNLAKRRGFVYPSGEIYGGLRSGWDYGPLGVELKENIKRAWWRSVVQLRDDVVGLDSSVILPSKTWEASRHLEVFNDALVECLKCNHRFKAEDVGDKCPDCGHDKLTDPRNFNTMFRSNAGPVADEGSTVWLRPETAQGIFINFSMVLASSRKKIPFGIAQLGKVFRNEITPGNFIFRTREFEQMEMEYFVKPGTDLIHHQSWIDARLRWYYDLGLNPERLRLREHEASELAHYAKRTVDIEYNFPWGWGELEGIANRTDYDLTRHQEVSGQDLSFFEAETSERYVPYVIEPAAGATRALLAFLVDAYTEDEAPTASGGVEKRTVLRLHRQLAPIKVAVLPLSRHDSLVPVAKEVAASLRTHFRIDYDDAGAIGRRYRRQDEIGTPFAVTVDFESLDDKAFTVRERDSMQQERLPLNELIDYLRDQFLWGDEA